MGGENNTSRGITRTDANIQQILPLLQNGRLPSSVWYYFSTRGHLQMGRSRFCLTQAHRLTSHGTFKTWRLFLSTTAGKRGGIRTEKIQVQHRRLTRCSDLFYSDGYHGNACLEKHTVTAYTLLLWDIVMRHG